MTKFVYAVYDDGNLDLDTVVANSIEDAKDKIMAYYRGLYEDLESDNWDDFLTELDESYYVYLGDLYDIETL